MNNTTHKILFLLVLMIYNCGTGPWFIQKNLYEIYKEPIYINSNWNFKTNGYYSKLSDSSNTGLPKNVLVFNDKGYCTSISQKKLKTLIKSRKKIEAELNWWQIKNDSIIIENYGKTKRLIKTLIWWHKGKVLNDSIIEIAYKGDDYSYKPVKYKFIKSDQVPELINKSRYYTKDWYLTNLNESRKE